MRWGIPAVAVAALLSGCGAAVHHQPHSVRTTTSTAITTTVPVTTTIKVPAPTTVKSAPQTREAEPGYGCMVALAFLDTHMAPGWRAECPAYADGHQAATCWDIPGLCPGYYNKVVLMAVPCPASELNEAHNTWVFYYEGYYATGPWDGYGHC